MKRNQKETKSTFNLQVEPEVQLQVYSASKGVLEGSKVSWNTCYLNDQKWSLDDKSPEKHGKIKSMNPKNQSELLINYDKI